ncbi:MAG: TetR/AcrR family transcriptional regulator [Coprococcus sp.]|nr:TetR/AcrR family transcriptional regulator [Coprococcus sp.]
MDLRVQKTRNSIFSAFIELRATKPIEKITVKELSAKANISKQTFYLHFKDIYDLSEYLENDAVSSLVADIPNPDFFITNSPEATRQLCKAALSQGNLFNILFPDDDRSYGVLTNKIEKKIKEIIFESHPELRNDIRENVIISLFIQGSVYTFMKYKDSNATEVTEILADIIKKITDK